MKLMITGGAGFIGSNFIYYMLRHHPDDELVCVDALTYAGNPETLAPIKDRITFIKADISDKDAVDCIFLKDRYDAVVNFAAESHVDRSIAQHRRVSDDECSGRSKPDGRVPPVRRRQVSSGIHRRGLRRPAAGQTRYVL
jgi:dTDP-D-glucose 4,6-dehydratase